MIQRIQTIWLLIITLLSVILFFGGIIEFTSSEEGVYLLGFSGITNGTAGDAEILTRSPGMMITMVLIPVLSVGAVFLYKKIRLQKTVALLVVAFSICLCILTGFYWYSIGAKFDGVPVPGIKMVFPLLITVFSVLAYRGIVKDENLLKSYDRLR